MTDRLTDPTDRPTQRNYKSSGPTYQIDQLPDRMGHREITLPINDWHRYAGYTTHSVTEGRFFSSLYWRLPIFLFFAIIESRPCPFSNERVFEGGKIHIPSIRYTGGRNIHFVPKLRLTYAPLFRSLWGRLLWCPAVQAGQFLRWRTAAQDASSLEKKRNKVKIPKF